MGQAKANDPNGLPSNPLDLKASAFSTTSNSSQDEIFRWQAQATGSNSVNPKAKLSLLFGSAPNSPQDTGFSVNADGTINFAPNQQLPASAVQDALSGTGSSSSGSSSLPPVVNTAGYAWSETPGTSSSAIQVGSNTVTLTPCPRGVNGSDLWHYLYISGTGTPEAVLIAGGTCTSGAQSGTVQFSAKYPHAVGCSIGSATAGIQESVIDAVMPKLSAQASRNVLIDPGDHTLYARLSIRASGVNISASGAVVTCMMQDTCIMLGDPANANAFSGILLQGLRVRPGVSQGTFAAVEDNAQVSTVRDLGPAPATSAGNSFGSLVQLDNDQAATIDGLNTNLGSWSRCDTQFCSTAVFGPGPFSRNAGVIWVKNSNLSLGCAANGIDNQDGNTLHVSDSVVQAYAQFGIRSNSTFGPNPAAKLDNVYEEVGNCVNPLGTGEAGLIVEGGHASVSGGEGPAGKLPQFASVGNTQYNYYVIVHSSTAGASPAYLAGYALTNGSGMIRVLWNQVGSAGVVTYDVLRTVGVLSPHASAPYGTGAFAIATGVTVANCSNKVCSVLDNAGLTPTLYTVPGDTTFWPALLQWPGPVILTSSHDIQNTGGAVPTKYFADTIPAGGIVSAAGGGQPSVFAQQCNPMGNWSSIWISCLSGSAFSNDFPPVVGTLLQLSSNGGAPGGLKGRLIFETPLISWLPSTHVITLADSNPNKTLATPMNRPTYDSEDTYIGYDQPSSVHANQTQLSFGSPVSISNYIRNVGDGTNWLERLTSNSKTFRVPVTVPTLQTSSNCISAAGACGSAAAGMVTIPNGSASITISTTAVTSRSEIHIDENTSYGPLLGVTCDTAFGRQYHTTAQMPGTAFVITTNSAPTGNPACLSYTLTN